MSMVDAAPKASSGKAYVIVVQGSAYPLSADSFAVEGAFAEHLRELRAASGSRYSVIRLIAAQMPQAEYERNRNHLATVTRDEGIEYVPAFPADASHAAFWTKHVGKYVELLKRSIADAALVHADLSTDVRRPTTALAAFIGRSLGKPTILVTDIDFRLHAERLKTLGTISPANYLINRVIQNPFKAFQIRTAVRKANLVMLKSSSLVRDFGGGAPHVKNFFNTAHRQHDLLTGQALQTRLERLAAPGPLKTTFFGRLIATKGVDRMIEAIGAVRAKGLDVTLTIIGDGPYRATLEAQVAAAGLGDVITFTGAVSYGAPLFDKLAEMDVALAAPLIEDTPRSAFDGFARAVPLIAFDISYFRDLAELSGAVALAAWPEARDLEARITELAQDRPRLAAMAERAVAFAAENTQNDWMVRRMAWTQEFVPAA